MNSLVQDLVGACKLCQQFKVSPTAGQKDLGLSALKASKPLEMISVDLIGPEPAVQGMRYMLIIVDVFSRFTRIISLSSCDTLSMLKALNGQWLNIFGLPDMIMSDCGSISRRRSMIDFSRKQFFFSALEIPTQLIRLQSSSFAPN